MGWLQAAMVIAMQVRLEEQHLLHLHGRTYAEYAAKVGRFVPGVGKIPVSV
jgi:protein-S-isoprenylcysteine O-methyltransferase Ste14